MRDPEKRTDKGKAVLIIAILAIVLLIVLRFVLYYIRNDGFSGISVLLPLFLLGFIAFALIMSCFFAAWVYQDCRKRNDDAALWAIIVFVATPFLGLLLYFLRRSEMKQRCLSCGHKISIKANYCEQCGIRIDKKEESLMGKTRTHHVTYIIAGVASFVLMLTCLTGFIVSAAAEGNVNTSVDSEDRVWNFGGITMHYNISWNGVWKQGFKSASDGFITQEKLNIKDASSESLYADISCATVPEGASLTLWLVQGDVSKSFDVTSLSEPLTVALEEFENGTLHVRLQINGVKDCTSEIYIK